MKSTNRWSTRLDVQSHEPGVVYTNLCYTTSGCSFVCTVLHTCQEVLLSLWHGNEYEWYSERRQQQSQALYHRGPGSSSLSSKVFGEDLCIFWYSSGRVPRRDCACSYIYVYKSFFVWRLSYYLNTEHSILIDDIYMSKSYADMVVGIHTQSKSVWVLFFLSLSLVSYSICLSGWGDLFLLRSTLHLYHRLLDYNPLWNHAFPSVWSGGSRWSY